MLFRSWVHIAVSRQSGLCRLFVNGELDASATITKSITARPTVIGGFRFTGFSEQFAGYLSNVRFIKGSALYTTNFTPPTSRLTAVSNTSLLALQTASVTQDSSINNLTITNNGSVTSLPPISWPTAQKQYANGVVEIEGVLDDYTKMNAMSAFFNGSQHLSITTPEIGRAHV